MSFEYEWNRNEANFGKPITHEVKGGTHITCENFLYHNGMFVALRRPDANPEHIIPKKARELTNDLLYFVHNLPIWGETKTNYINRVIKEYSGVNAESFDVVDVSFELYEEDEQWAVTIYNVVKIDKLPKPGIYGNKITEIVTFKEDNIPNEFGWWKVNELKPYLQKARMLIKKS